MTYDFELLPSHPHAGKRVRVVEGDTIQVVGQTMLLVEDAEGHKYYAKRSDLGQVTVTPLGPRRRGRHR